MKADRFELLIDLGNDAMRTRRDVARALRATAKLLDGSNDGLDLDAALDGGRVIRDANGNSVGRWWTSKETP